MYYRERWYFFSSKIWSYSLGGKWKIIFLKKNTCKYDIFFKCSKKMVFSKKLYWNMIFLVLSGKMVFFPKKHDISSLDGKSKMIFFKKYMEIWYFLLIRTGVTKMMLWPSAFAIFFSKKMSILHTGQGSFLF